MLNDEWVSHPTWASEEAGFQAHKKNTFEEALHKSEEERHEYHVQIEALSRTLALLEPLNTRIEKMSSEERALFRLPPGLGGPGRCLYQRIIKKVYGREHGGEVLIALQECPAVAVPVVLTRLRQKDEEWRRAQREWGRTWREVDCRNFYKSLDHLGIVFKAGDKKGITAKSFVGDIEGIKAKQLEDLQENGGKSFADCGVPPQLEYTFADTPVLHDSLKMVYSFLDHSQAQYSAPERRSVEKFLRGFVPMLCMYPEVEFNAACGPLEDEAASQPEVNGSGRRTPSLLGLSRKQQRASRTHTPSRPPTPALAPAPSPPKTTPEDVWILEASEIPPETEAPAGHERPFFANTTFYTLVRLLQVRILSLLLSCAF